MSHFTYLKTCFRNIDYLEKALKELDITGHKPKLVKTSLGTDIVIAQSNGHDITFTYSDDEYQLVTDLSFWQQSQSVEGFLNQLSQQYGYEFMIEESKKIGFQLSTSEEHQDNSQTITLSRWNLKTPDKTLKLKY